MNNHTTSLLVSRRLILLVSALALLVPSSLEADSIKQTNLREMCQWADKVFRGTVVSAAPGTVQVGGGELPVVTYRIRVDEAFKGAFQTVKGVRFTEIRMLAAPRLTNGGQARIVTSFPGMPQLEVGQRYLLLTTRPSRIGMSSPVGLGQGLFRITGAGGEEEAFNEYGNKMLFRGMEPPAMRQANDASQARDARQAGGPMKYSQLAEEIRGLVREERRKR